MQESDKGLPINFQCADAIEVSLYIEKEGLLFYEKASRHARSTEVKTIFTRLAGEEKEHIQSLKSKARFLRPALVKKSQGAKKTESFIAENLQGKVFPAFDEADTPKPVTDKDALEMGIESEKRSIEILSELLNREKKIDVRAIFSHLVVEEKKHLAALEEIKKRVEAESKP